jgi:dTMP kinase
MHTKIVAVTGVDGAGKSTIVRTLASQWANDGTRFVHKRERRNVGLVAEHCGPRVRTEDDWRTGEFADAVGLAACLDFLAHYDAEIAPYIGRVPLIVSDRYWHCFAAYLRGAKSKVDGMCFFRRIASADVVVHVSIDPSLLEQRYRLRGEAGEDETAAVMRDFESGYSQVFSEYSGTVVRVDNSGPLERAVDAVRAELTHLTR